MKPGTDMMVRIERIEFEDGSQETCSFPLGELRAGTADHRQVQILWDEQRKRSRIHPPSKVVVAATPIGPFKS